MKIIIFVTTIFIIFFSNSTLANNYNNYNRHLHHHHHNGFSLQFNFGNYGYNNRHNQYTYRNQRSYNRNMYSRPCVRVEKRGYWNGHAAIIGGVMCYNNYGNAYIVPDSRYLKYYIY